MILEPALSEVLQWLFRTPPPPAIDAKARQVMLDTFGCIVAARRNPEVARLMVAFDRTDPGSVAARAAQFAAASCWDEACEGLARAHGRPGLSVLAACCALGQAEALPVGDVVRAYLTGYEIGGRLGESLRIVPGMHVDGAWPAFGVAAGVVRLLGGDAATALSAVRIVACQMPYSLYYPVARGSTARNTYTAHSAQLGLLAASAALGGVEGPEGAIEELRDRALARALGSAPIAPAGEWLIAGTYFKAFAAVYHVHYGAVAALALREHLASRLAQIRRLRLHIYGEAIRYCGNRAPQTTIQAQFSLSYGLACALVTGDLSPAGYAPQVREAPLLQALERMVELSEDTELSAAGKRGATLTVELEDGEVLAHAVAAVPGEPARPMTREEILAKFARYAALEASRGAAFLDAPADRRFTEVSPL